MFGVTYRQIAAHEYEEAISWYKARSISAAENFVTAVETKLDSISTSPAQYKNLYRNYYEVSLSKYPYTIVYFLDKTLSRVVIVAIYHHKRNPKKKYRR